MLKARDKARLRGLRGAVKEARRRRREALKRARALCKVGRGRVRQQVKALRKLERERVNRIVAELKARERGACAARKLRVKAAGGSTESKRRQLLALELLSQKRVREATQRAIATAERSTKRERRQESDDAVATNLPPQFRWLWQRMSARFKGSKRASRTEEFLEWAEANPEEVLRLQSDQADRDVERLVREQQRLEKKLKSRASYETCPDDVARLTKMGLAPSQVAARRLATGLSMPAPPF